MSKNKLEVWVVEVINNRQTAMMPGQIEREIIWCKTKEDATAKVNSLIYEGKVSVVTKWVPVLNWDPCDYPTITWKKV